MNPHIGTHVRWVELRDGTVIAYNMRTAEYLEVRAAMTVQIWLALDGSRSLKDVVEYINFRRPREIAPLTDRMVERVVEGLAAMGLLSEEVCDTGGAGFCKTGRARPWSTGKSSGE